MLHLSVENFSCIHEAELELSRLTVIIGPQASGKSVLSKLVYFGNSLLSDQFTTLDDTQSHAGFKKYVAEKFDEWFPRTAWGSKKFLIEFTAGEYKLRLTRRVRGSHPSQRVQVTLSPFFEEQYASLLPILAKQIKNGPSEQEFLAFYRIREVGERTLQKRLGSDYFGSQLFVPAGRSFFTSVGKAVAAFEQARLLDPLTLQFGRYFASVRDRRQRGISDKSRSRLLSVTAMKRLLGGKLIHKRDREYIETDDGRQIPFAALSSGQQELLPLWYALEQWTDRRFARAHETRRLLFIEEPEAHLFPTAQSWLVELLASIVMSARESTDLLVTTHSPYVLSKINNLIMAGQLGSINSEALNTAVDKIVPKPTWLSPNSTSSYAIMDGRLTPISGIDGLIDAEYLDSASNDISREFSSLLGLEILK